MYTNCVIPFYIFNKIDKKYQSVGSAVLLEYRSRRFLISAAHVVEEMQGHKNYIYFERTFYEIGGFPAVTSNFELFDSRQDDPLDLAAILLPSKLEIQSANSKFITIDECIKSELIASELYQAIGYPYSKNTRAANRTANVLNGFRSEIFRYTVNDVADKSFPYKQFSPEYHIATSLTKKGRMQGFASQATIPDLHGMSGGLLQKVIGYNKLTDGFDFAYPSGIILEQNKQKNTFYLLRLMVVYEWLEMQWEHVIKP